LEDIVQFRVNVTVHHTFKTHGLYRLILALFVNQSGDDQDVYVIQEGFGRTSVIVRSLIGFGHWLVTAIVNCILSHGVKSDLFHVFVIITTLLGISNTINCAVAETNG
jgi:hypothetical protein